MCALLSEHGITISAATYEEWIHKSPTARARRDADIVAIMTAYRARKTLVTVSGSGKMWLYLRGKGHDVARCTIERLYREQGWEGAPVRQEGPHHDPRPPPSAAPDLVQRRFFAPTPNRLW